MSEESQTPDRSATAQTRAARLYADAAEGRFELLGELGRGSSGTVHRARLLTAYGDVARGAEVAIKFLRVDRTTDERALQRFRSEGELGRKLRHGNLAAIHALETVQTEHGEVSFLVMQFVAGDTLRDFLQKSQVAVEDLVRRIGSDAAAGLAALHGKGLIHRDVKPENLILTPDSQLKIVDLGLVRPFGQGGGSGSSSASGFGLAGSVAYAAPESLRGDRVGPRSDLYSLGIVLFEVATGEHPFQDATTADAMIDAHLHREPPPAAHVRPSVSPLLGQLLRAMLSKDPDRRPKDAAELSRILAQGEQSEYWRRLEAQEPVRASRRRLLAMRRPAEAELVGRRDELLQLDRAMQNARSGHGQVVAITGPHGAGRRRLLDHAIERWLDQPDPPLLLGGEADRELGHAEPFASTLLDVLLRGDDHGSPQAEARAAAAARTIYGLSVDDAAALAAVAMGRSPEKPEVRADRLATALLALARPRRAVVLRVDHAEHLDTSGQLVLQRLARRADRSPILVLLTTGTDDVPADRRIEIGGLAEREFLRFGHALFRPGEVDDAFLRAAHETLSGVPGNLVEALDHLVSEGRLAGSPGAYRDLQPGVELDPAPDHVQRFVQRVRSLPAEAREVLTAAAVLGRRGLLADLVRLTGRPELAVLETLSLFRGRIVRAQGGQVWFRHRRFAKALLDVTPLDRRRELHLLAADQLQERGASSTEVGMHFSQALAHDRAIAPLLDGLAELVRSSSRRTALRIAGRVAAHLQHVEDTPANAHHRLRLLLLHAEARVNNRQQDAAVRDYRAAETLARELGDGESSAAARVGLAGLELAAGHLLTAIALLESVHDDLAPGNARTTAAARIAARAHGLHGRILLYQGQAVAGHRHLQAALRRLPAEDDELRCHLRIDLARLEALQYHFPTALKTLQQIDKDPAARNLPRVRLRLLLYRGHMRSLLGDDDAAQDLRFAIDEAEQLSLPSYGGRAELYLGERQFWRGRDEDARDHFERACVLAIAGGDRLGEAMSRAYLVRLGDTDTALAEVVERLAMPSVAANWLLAAAGAGEVPAAHREVLEELAASQDLQLFQHLRILLLSKRPASARSLIRTIAQRIPERRARRRFLALWPKAARI